VAAAAHLTELQNRCSSEAGESSRVCLLMQGPGSTVPELVLVIPKANSSLLLDCRVGGCCMC
jgi:hypothetical protein